MKPTNTHLMIFIDCLFAILLFMSDLNTSVPRQDVSICCQEPATSPFIQEITIETAAFLEGALSFEDFKMTNRLNKLGYLPGQKPKAFFGKATQSGQPYRKNPWNYQGKEGVAKENKPFQYSLDVVDWILISLRESESSSSTVYTTSALIYKDGSIVSAPESKTCTLDINKKYYIVLQHRNHLAVMSEKPVAISDQVIKYDFRYSPSFEEGQKAIKDGIFAMYAGNADQVNSPDAASIIDEEDLKKWESANGQNSSYFIMDLDLSGDVSIKDQELLYNNMGVFSTVPL